MFFTLFCFVVAGLFGYGAYTFGSFAVSMNNSIYMWGLAVFMGLACLVIL